MKQQENYPDGDFLTFLCKKININTRNYFIDNDIDKQQHVVGGATVRPNWGKIVRIKWSNAVDTITRNNDTGQRMYVATPQIWRAPYYGEIMNS